MKTHIQKWGNSLALRIPKSFAAAAGLTQDTEVDLSLVDGKVVVTPRVVPGATLAELLEGVTEHNLHREVETGPAVGAEAW